MNICALSILLVAGLAAASNAPAVPLDVAQREVLALGAGPGVSRQTVATRLAARAATPDDKPLVSQPLQLVAPDTAMLDFEAPPTVRERDVSYALALEVAPGAEPPTAYLNERPINRDAFVRDGWAMYRLPTVLMKAGVNALELRGATATLATIGEVAIFSLNDTFEEVHFETAMAAASDDPIRFVQPANHPDMAKYDVEHYTLDMTLNMASTAVSGKVTVQARVVAGPMSQLVLDFDPNGGALAISSVDSGPSTPALSFTTDDVNDRLFVTLASPAATNDVVTVRITYAGTPATNGVFGAPYRRSTHGASVPIVFTFSEPYGARKWWPCKDEPSDKATTTTIITVANGYFPVSNGELVSTTPVGGGSTRYTWEHNYPVATYLVSIACTNYAYQETTYTGLDGVTTMPIGHYVYPENTSEFAGLTGTKAAMEFFADTFGEYPFLAEKYVTATHTSNSGMEHQTCTSMPDLDLLPDGTGRRNIHELGHAWFGDRVTMRHFDHLWLNEGWATYCEALFYEHRDGRAPYHNYVNAWDASNSRVADTPALVNTSADSFSNALVYEKGGFVLHMLRRVMGDAAFFQGTRDYLVANGYGNAVTADFEAAMEGQYGSDLSWFFNQWVYGTGRPTYGWSWLVTGPPGDRTVQLTVTQSQAGAAFRMPIEIVVHSTNAPDQTFTVENTTKNQVFNLDMGAAEPFDLEFDPNNYVLKYTTVVTPGTPTLLHVRGNAAGNAVEVAWVGGVTNAAGYQLLTSPDLVNWTLAAGTDTLGVGATTWTSPTMAQGTTVFVRLRGVSSAGTGGEYSDVYGVRLGGAATPRVLVVDGYDRWSTQAGRGPSHPWAAWHGMSVAAYGAAFDSCANEQVGGAFVLGNYPVVMYELGEESTADQAFSTTEQALIQTYLRAGGQMMVTGAEIGWDLDQQGSTGDKTFYNTFLKADYVADDSGSYTATGEVGGIFAGLSFAYDNGSAGIYFCDYPDVLTTISGSTVALRYGSGTVAATQFSGVFPSGTTPGKMVNFGFPFETITTQPDRDAVMDRVLTWFGAAVVPPASSDSLSVR